MAVVGIILIGLLIFALILVGLTRKWAKAYKELNESIKLAVLNENAVLRDTLKDEAIFKEHLRQDLDKAVKILKVRIKPVDNELTQVWVSTKNIPVLTERFDAYKKWIYPEVSGAGEVGISADLEDAPSLESQE